MDATDDPVVEIQFDCLPLKRVGRVDVPLDASESFRKRIEHLKRMVEKHDAGRAYFLYDARCVFRTANSDVEGLLRFEFEGAVLTDAGDRKTAAVDIESRLTSNTCGELPPAVLSWLAERVEAAIAIEFDRYIAAGQLEAREAEFESGQTGPGLSVFQGSGV